MIRTTVMLLMGWTWCSMFLGCTSDGTERCSPGTVLTCDCPPGQFALQICSESGQWSPEICICATETGRGEGDGDISHSAGVVDAFGDHGGGLSEEDASSGDGGSSSFDVGGEGSPDGTEDAGTYDAEVLDESDSISGDGELQDTVVGEDVESEDGEQTLPVSLYNDTTTLDPPVLEWTDQGLVSRFADRARDRHAREDEFEAYDHFLSFYWEHRTVAVEVVDTIPVGGDSITFNVTTQWKLDDNQAELRFFYRGMNTVAEYHNNGVMTPLDTTHYTRSVNYNPKTNGPLQVGDRMEFELSQFLDAPPQGRDNYYGTAFLYVVGEGNVPWEAKGIFGDFSTELEDSYPIPEKGWLGGRTTLPYAYSGENDHHFIQMATNLSSLHGQNFVEGRRVHHTNFGDGTHNESDKNPVFQELKGQLGQRFVNHSCVSCHQKNGRALAPEEAGPLPQFVIRVGDGEGGAHPLFGHVLQPQSKSGFGEPQGLLAQWEDVGELRRPVFEFEGEGPLHFSARIAPQLVGMGLLEAIPEEALLALADPDDQNGDGISGRLRLVMDQETGDWRAGRLGWKASQPSVRGQVAAALQTDMGVMTSVYPSPDCGDEQESCEPPNDPLDEEQLEKLVLYNSLLGVRARRDLESTQALEGESLFQTIGCAGCHVESFETSSFHPLAELRNQLIHPYTDLLLHDMGEGLADTLEEGGVSASEWRTAPLWGIGLTQGVSGGQGYLHDGRARTLEEAILWHGGEGLESRQAFEALSEEGREAVLVFLGTL